MPLPKRPVWPSLPELEEACNSEMYGLENPGFCLACGNQQDGCEPDAREYKCEDCGERQVYGAQEVLLMGCYA